MNAGSPRAPSLPKPRLVCFLNLIPICLLTLLIWSSFRAPPRSCWSCGTQRGTAGPPTAPSQKRDDSKERNYSEITLMELLSHTNRRALSELCSSWLSRALPMAARPDRPAEPPRRPGPAPRGHLPHGSYKTSGNSLQIHTSTDLDLQLPSPSHNSSIFLSQMPKIS